jgi:uncharacterized Ntn-hydrolase superfamily protein
MKRGLMKVLVASTLLGIGAGSVYADADVSATATQATIPWLDGQSLFASL